MLIIDFLIIMMMTIGLICTLAPRLCGTVIILVAAIIYAMITGINHVPLWVIPILLLLSFIAECFARGLRVFLTKDYKVSRIYSVNTTLCNLAGITVAQVGLGPFLGIIVWEVLIGKAFLPRMRDISKVLVRLFLVAVLRYICGLAMIMIIIQYMMKKM